MSSSNYGCSADTVTNDFVKKHCPEVFEAFEKVLGEADVDIQSFFYAQYMDGDYSEIKEDFDAELVDKAYGDLKEDFFMRTGLSLSTVYHDAEERSDELDGGAWAVEGVYGLTEAGRNHKDSIEHVEWTTFG